jgi:hypothetical protein
MKSICTSITLLVFLLIVSGGSHAQDDLSALRGPYLGQKPPGLTPEVFASGLVSTEHRDRSVAFSPDLKEFYFSRKHNENGKWWSVAFISENNQWGKPVVVPREGTPFISPDGQVMHLGGKYRKRTDIGWSEKKSLGPLFEAIPIMRLTASTSGTYVFDEATRSGLGMLRYSVLTDGKRRKPQTLAKEINTGKWNAHPFIASDESYLIWDGERDGGFGGNDLYVSFRQLDGAWGPAINLGNKINTELEDADGFVTSDGKYLFFSRNIDDNNADIYWVDAQVIENLRPKP